MSSRRAARTVPTRSAGAPGGVEQLLVPLGLLLAMGLPFVVVSTMSDQAHHETKLFALAASGALALAGLALSREPGSGRETPRLLRGSAVALGTAAACALVSAAVNHAVVDPLALLSFLAPAALFVAGASAEARRAAPRLLAVLGACGAASGALAFGQRFLSLPRLPLEVPQARFLSTALVGNPGELAAALVIPALVLWAQALDEARPRRGRVLAAAGFLSCGLGLGAAETITPIAAVLAGMLVHAFLSPRRRLLPLGVALLAGAGILAATGAGARVLEKLLELRSGQIAHALTQRDIGLAAGAQMIARAPLFGVGPGAFENSFVPARLAAERHARRRFIHLSDSAHFENAHCEPVTFAAETGVPSALLAFAAFLLLVAAFALRGEAPGLRDTLLPGLLAFVVLSLGSFPLRMPASAGAFALLAGLAWRGSGGGLPLPARPRLRRGIAGVAAALLLAVGAARLLAALWQARGETVLRQAAATSEGRADLLAEARAALSRSLTFRPRNAAAWLALGSCERLGGDAAAAWSRTARSFALEERAETDLDLGILAFGRGDHESAQRLFVRAVWLFPLLAQALDEEYAPGSVELDVADLETRLASGGELPPLPPAVDALRLRRRFP